MSSTTFFHVFPLQIITSRAITLHRASHFQPFGVSRGHAFRTTRRERRREQRDASCAHAEAVVSTFAANPSALNLDDTIASLLSSEANWEFRFLFVGGPGDGDLIFVCTWFPRSVAMQGVFLRGFGR